MEALPARAMQYNESTRHPLVLGWLSTVNAQHRRTDSRNGCVAQAKQPIACWYVRHDGAGLLHIKGTGHVANRVPPCIYVGHFIVFLCDFLDAQRLQLRRAFWAIAKPLLRRRCNHLCIFLKNPSFRGLHNQEAHSQSDDK